jgi:hypothetical protein
MFKAKPDKNRQAVILVKKLHDKFFEAYGSVVCRDIQQKVFGKSFQMIKSIDNIIIIDMDEFEKAGAHADRGCPIVVGTAAKWTAELLMQEIAKTKK